MNSCGVEEIIIIWERKLKLKLPRKCALFLLG